EEVGGVRSDELPVGVAQLRHREVVTRGRGGVGGDHDAARAALLWRALLEQGWYRRVVPGVAGQRVAAGGREHALVHVVGISEGVRNAQRALLGRGGQ